jgi:hypothetical protein
MAVLVTLATGFSGLAAWRIALSDDDAGDFNYSGLAAAAHAEEQRSLVTTDVYRQLQMYLRYRRYDFLDQAVLQAGPGAGLPVEVRHAGELAANAFVFFPTRYVNPDGTYSAQRQIQERLAEAAIDRDIDADRHFAQSDQARLKGSYQAFLPIVVALAVLFYVLAEKARGRIRFALAGVGTVWFAAGLIGLMLIETQL